ncbi:hypothetical protein CFAM422_004110 [Trichoderma lentiforme]|uniref:Uncharacterized protein n=1 Tax=Trichoderma lentiforme TaxID=1567552 RepID=A0A9P5CDL5_9HYPO|nr:hypothetical protein CFAM422_004110 [Trichoderma lentiforme]
MARFASSQLEKTSEIYDRRLHINQPFGWEGEFRFWEVKGLCNLEGHCHAPGKPMDDDADGSISMI